MTRHTMGTWTEGANIREDDGHDVMFCSKCLDVVCILCTPDFFLLELCPKNYAYATRPNHT